MNIFIINIECSFGPNVGLVRPWLGPLTKFYFDTDLNSGCRLNLCIVKLKKVSIFGEIFILQPAYLEALKIEQVM